MTNVVEALVPGGKATPGPPLGPALGPLGINIKDVIAQINEKTKEYNGMDVPVKVIVDDDKNVEVEVGTPPTSALIMKEVGIEKGTGDTYNVVGNLSMDQIMKITRLKREDVLSYSFKNAMKEIVGTCVPIGVTVEGMSPKDCQKAIDQGKFDDTIEAEG
ncbi:Ribosomal protein L11-like protein [Methanohalobium evestigatum Z-7303]|jgi:large subunit ribosomal protein L11|uniref:Large ribosomal subunit protein uL11 n=1 Tax=Methanohalobium evestigatum (strain ATCC BAA-1072 / DSM 3721 / NBRC 107634 / OCM 161 / Z-7303) TaxID=644295 RepID=D7EAD9_METEZ|nr:50S ribosomal protein L11 [Methanohalobium evestigatum]ADI74938.1 Ribosomal protein L11-like protein [Methanohalobium evestigatum Z-7303]